jgi:hypothetical protein
MRGTKPKADPHPPSPLGLVPPLPHCGRGAFELNTLGPLSRTAGEGAEGSEAGEGWLVSTLEN